jgi:hypothetical protein
LINGNSSKYGQNLLATPSLCAECVPESNRSMGNFCGQLQDAQGDILDRHLLAFVPIAGAPIAYQLCHGTAQLAAMHCWLMPDQSPQFCFAVTGLRGQLNIG